MHPSTYPMYITHSSLQKTAQYLTADLPITLYNWQSQQPYNHWQLILNRDGLWFNPPSQSSFKPYAFSFLQKNLQRRAQQLGQKTPLIKALGKAKDSQTIIDTTAGLGRDAFLLANRNVKLTLLDQNPLLIAGLRYADWEWRGLAPGDNPNWLCYFGDSCQLLPQLPQADIIYIDPMFPENTKSALVKKEAQLLQQLNQGSQDEHNLLKYAILKGERRIVVKRPRSGPYIQHHYIPDYQVFSKTHRYDVYLTQ